MSVVIPTHNRPDLLPVTLRSVLWQRDVDLEVVVVDDGSADTAAAQLVAATADDRIRYVRQDPAQGVSVARNRGVSEASGQWVAFCDDDDLWAPDKLALQLEALGRTGRNWVYTGEVHIGAHAEVIGGLPPRSPDEVVTLLPRSNVVPGGCSAVMLKRPSSATPLFDDRYRHFADWDLWLRLARQGPPAWVPRPLVGYRVHEGNRSLDIEGMVAELDLIDEWHATKVDRASFYRYAAVLCRRSGRRGDALAYYLRATGSGRTGRGSGSRRRRPSGEAWRQAARGWLSQLPHATSSACSQDSA